ncbi:hypothetical protein LINGRAHAP2_LOCUS23884, partial [Linum grandiflorum]
KFDAKSDEGIFLGYSSHSKAYRIFNKRSQKVEETINVTFDETSCEDISLQDIDNDVFGIPNAPTDIITDNPVIVSTIKVDE